jgi:hypothetical protein
MITTAASIIADAIRDGLHAIARAIVIAGTHDSTFLRDAGLKKLKDSADE